MAVIYRVDNDGIPSFFAMKGEAAKFRRQNKDNGPSSIQQISLRGRKEIVELLNEVVDQTSVKTAEDDSASEFLG